MILDFSAETASLDADAIRSVTPPKVLGFSDIFREKVILSSVVIDDGRVEAASERRDSGVGIRLAVGPETFSVALADPTKSAFTAAVRELSAARKLKKPPLFAALRLPPPIEVIGKTLAEKTQLLWEMERAARSVSKKVGQVRVTYKDYARAILVTRSDGVQRGDSIRGFYLSVLVTVSGRGKVQTGYDALGGTLGWELFNERDPVEAAKSAVLRALTMLDAKRAPSGKMPVVMAAQAGGTMIHEAVGHGLEADLYADGHSIYGGKIGEMVASPLVTVVDDPTLPGKRGSYTCDDEGTVAAPTALIEGGVLKRLMQSRETTLRTGLAPSANGRRESWRVPPIPRMSNTMIMPGSHEPGEIIADTHRGLYVTRMGGGQVDTVSGDFVFEVDEGFLIEGGKIGRPVRGATIAGNGPDALMSIDRVGRDLGFSIGTCGKDGQGAPVADAQPTIRIPELTVGGS